MKTLLQKLIIFCNNRPYGLITLLNVDYKIISLLRIERSQLSWLGHISRMTQERLPKHVLLAKANGRRAVGRSRTRWAYKIEDLGWNRLGL